MSGTGQWEVVGKPNKKEKVAYRPMSKSQAKQFVENMPRIEINDPIEKSHTMFDAFIPKVKRSEALKDSNQSNVRANGVSAAKKPAAAKPKKKQEATERKPKTLEEAASRVDKSELQLIFTQSHESFPENPDVWLKDLASFLNLRFEKLPENDAVFKGKPTDYPLCTLTKSCREVLVASMKKCSDQTLEHLFYHCVQSMLTEAQKGLATYGYRMFIQALAFYRPDTPLSKFPQYFDLLKTHHNRPLRCLSILWALGQIGVKKLKCGLRVWLDLMMPALGFRSIAPYCVEYIEHLFIWHKDLKQAYSSLTLRDYFQVLDILFSSSGSIQGDLKKRLQVQYPKIKTISFGENPSKSLRNFFPSYLSRLMPTCNQQLKQELVSNLITCLQTDKHTFSTWCQMYTKHLLQSGVLLDHISTNWPSLKKKIDYKMLKQTLTSFSVTNDEVAAQSRNLPDGHQTCVTACRELLQKMGSNPFPWFYVVFPVFVVLVAIISYDIYTSRSLKQSRTVKFMDNYGILSVLDQAWKKTRKFFTQVIGWLTVNVPVMYASVCRTVGPYVSQAWKTLSTYTVWAMEVSRPHRQYVAVKVGEGINWVSSLNPNFWTQLQAYLWVGWELAKDYTLWLWKYVLHIGGDTHTWLLQHVLVGQFSPENLYKTASWSLLTVHNYTMSVVGWCRHTFTGSISN